MDNPVSIRDVAARAGVAVGTVSNVLNRPQLVAEATRNRVHQAIADMGFVRNESARQLKAGASRTIGLIVLDVANPFFTDVARGVEDAANSADLAVILCNSDGDPTKELRYLDILDEQRVRGILITPVNLRSDRLKRSRARGTAVVLLDYPSHARDQCSAAVDDALGGELAVTHLLSRGHNRIGFVGGPMGIRQVKDRYDGAIRAVAAAGSKRGRHLILLEQASLSAAEGRRALSGTTTSRTSATHSSP
jgi:LacI family transcriptional regulator